MALGGSHHGEDHCYVEFHVKNKSTYSVKSALLGVPTAILYTINHVGWTKSRSRNQVGNLENEWLIQSEAATMELGIYVLDLHL
jgi:hypothetical protein